MWSFGKVTCQACRQAFPRREMKFSPQERGVGVCHGCIELWRGGARRCVRCQDEVKPTQQAAFFQDRKGFGHFDCGGTPISS